MYKFLLLFVTFLCFSVGLSAQNKYLSTKSKKAENLYYKAEDYIRTRDFSRALTALADATKADPKFAEAYLKSASIHKMMGNKAATFDPLAKGLSLAKHSPAYVNYYFDLAELYFDRGDYQNARAHYENFIRAKPRNSRQMEFAQQQIKTAVFAQQAMQRPVVFKPELLPSSINKFDQQYFPYSTADQRYLVYTARAGIRAEHEENIYLSQRRDGEWQPPVSISNAINSPANEGAATISGDGKTLVFTSCNRPDSRGDCDLYISFRTGNDWSSPTNMGTTVNSKAWDSQPSLSADGRTLYFTSTRGGGLGKEDIWVTHLNEDGSWQKPANVGAPINSPNRDTGPFIHASGTTLYFASDGHQGLGGLDLYLATLGADNKWSEPKNMGYPLNTHADEGSVFISSDNKTGYYSRAEMTEAGAISTQLYSFEVPEVWKSKDNSTYAQGRVFDADTKKPLGAIVQLYDVVGDTLIQQVNSDKISGEYTVVLTQGKQYALYVSAARYLMNSTSFDYSTPKALSPLALDVYLKPVKAGAAVVLNNLFFDTNKYTLEQKSKTELNKLIAFMQQNETVKIEISGHTDDVGTDEANKVLSEKRATSVVEYLSSKGISKDRLRARGYGKTKPVKPNSSDENRSLNRRIELQIL